MRLAAAVSLSLLLMPAGAGASSVQVTSGPLSGIACATPTSCTAVGAGGSFATADLATWTQQTTVPLTAVSCAPAGGCVAVGAGGKVVAAGKTTVVDPDVDFTAVSCAPGLCAAVGNREGADSVTATMTDPAGAWHEHNVDRGRCNAQACPALYAQLTGISCPSSSFCVVVDDAGYVLTSSDPSGGAWPLYHADSGTTAGHVGPVQAGFLSVTCPSVSECLANDSAGSELASASPAVAGEWTRTSDRSVHDDVGGAPSCPTVSFCVGTFPSWTEDPLHGPWLGWPSATGAAYAGVACPSTTLCVGVDYRGVATTFEPLTRARAEAYLAAELRPARPPSISKLLSNKGSMVPYTLLSGGLLELRWSYKRKVIASGKHIYFSTGLQQPVTLRLRHSAIARLRKVKRARITATVTIDHGLLTASRSFALSR